MCHVCVTLVMSSSGSHLLTNKGPLVKAMVFPVVIYRCECWTIKKAEHQRIDAFKLLLEKTLESPLDSMEIKSTSEVVQSCPTLCDPMDCSPPGSIHGIF